MYSNIVIAPSTPSGNRYRKIILSLFTATLAPLVYFYIQHKVHKIAGGAYYCSALCAMSLMLSIAYSIYAIFEWSLIFYDVTFDAVAISDFADFEVRLIDNAPSETRALSGPYPIEKFFASLSGWHRSTRLFCTECFFCTLLLVYTRSKPDSCE